MGYLDPGILGMITQVGYLLLFAFVSAFMFFFQPLKNLFNRVFKREEQALPSQETEDAAHVERPGA